MAFGKTLVLASDFDGKLLDEAGAPVPNVKVTRSWEWAWTSDTGSDSTVTDAEGRFAFGQVHGKSFTASFIPHQPVIHQEIKAETANGPVLIFSVDKQNYDANSEGFGRGLKNPNLNMICRIDQEPGDAGPFWGTCIENTTND